MRPTMTIAGAVAAVVLSAPAQSEFAISGIRRAGTNAVEIAWPSQSNRWYRLERTTNLLTGAWETVFPSALATVPTNTYGVTPGVSAPVFWRVIGDTAGAYFRDNGTIGDDVLVTLGTTNRDWIAQYGLAGNDTLYAEGNADDDWIEQYGDDGNDYLDTIGGIGGDFIGQFGGDGSDRVFADGGSGNDRIVQRGGQGDDSLEGWGGSGNDCVDIAADEGNDAITIKVGDGDDRCVVAAGPGVDEILFTVGAGNDNAIIDGGLGEDTLTILSNNQSFTVYDGEGHILYQKGVGGSSITVRNVEHGTILGDDANPVFTW